MSAATRRRTESLGRLTRVREQMRQLAELKLGRLQTEDATLAHAERELVAALNAGDPLHGLFTDATARQLRRAGERRDAIRAAVESATIRLRDETARLKRSERLRDDATREHERSGDAADLSEIIEAALARRGASLP